ncbi:Glycosyl transferase family 2 [Thiothrix caldifontis]|uniref:Glycosyl transferase family 2 n=1 Tax=Thiothrix caldifontis TaxID=525918 RepID=A0A1H4GVU8_9GAMM|nr:glycosyltransferase [Thiothrix caldifontis]SEB13726.1 Glycosyl transferase family 2 [Thiothrix caldifontis]
MNKQKPSICLNMIVKNESKVITRCLNSVKDKIDYWVISDTGSTDGTQQIIRDYFAQHNIDGILIENEWRDFAHNRNIALEHARDKADYILIMDADDCLMAADDFQFGNLTADSYNLNIRYNELQYANLKLISTRLPWKWQGVLHEYLETNTPFTNEILQGDYFIRASTEGARSNDPNKYQNDANVLIKALQNEPNNTRYRFYLAQSYRDAGNAEAAIEHYQQRAAMGGWAEEAWYSLFEIARLKEQCDHPSEEIINAYIKAYEYRPQRAESLYHLARYLRIHNRFALAYPYALVAANTSIPKDILFVLPEVYRWKAKDELAVIAYWIEHYQECMDLCDNLLSDPELPAEERSRIQQNLQFAADKLVTPVSPS